MAGCGEGICKGRMSEESMPITMLDVLPLIEKFKKIPGNSCGGSLHIILDDGNIDDGCVRFCIEEATTRGDPFGREIAEQLLVLSKTQRRKLCALWGRL